MSAVALQLSPSLIEIISYTVAIGVVGFLAILGLRGVWRLGWPGTRFSPPPFGWKAAALVSFCFILPLAVLSVLQSLSTTTTNQERSPPPQSPDAFLGAILFQCVFLGLALMVGVMHGKRIRQTFGLGLGNSLQLVLRGTLALIFYMPTHFLISGALFYVLKLFEVPPEPQEAVQQMRHAAPGILALSIVLAVIVAPICEEFLYRGLIFRGFRQRLGLWPAMALSGAIFALVHDGIFAKGPIFCLGMLLAYVYDRSGRIEVPIAAHATFNAVNTALILSLPEKFLGF